MNEKNHSALVPRTPGALERAEPGTKRIISSMVADTLAVAQSKTAVPEKPFQFTSDAAGEAEVYYQQGEKFQQQENYGEAVRCFREAAERGHVNAQWELGSSYYNGLGVTRDYIEAVSWYRKAAAKGNDLAQFALGICYEDGSGVSQDYCEAYKFYKLATGDDLVDANLCHWITKLVWAESSQVEERRWTKGVKALVGLMTAEQVAEGERRCRESTKSR